MSGLRGTRRQEGAWDNWGEYTENANTAGVQSDIHDPYAWQQENVSNLPVGASGYGMGNAYADSGYDDEESTVYTDCSTFAPSTIAEEMEATEIARWLSKLSLGKRGTPQSNGSSAVLPQMTYQPVLATVQDEDEEDEDDFDSDEDSSLGSEEVRKEVGFWMQRLGIASPAKAAPVEDSDVSYSDDSQSSEEEDFFRKDYMKPATPATAAWTASPNQVVSTAYNQQRQLDNFTKPSTAWTPEALATEQLQKQNLQEQQNAVPTQQQRNIITKPSSTWTPETLAAQQQRNLADPSSAWTPEALAVQNQRNPPTSSSTWTPETLAPPQLQQNAAKSSSAWTPEALAALQQRNSPNPTSTWTPETLAPRQLQQNTVKSSSAWTPEALAAQQQRKLVQTSLPKTTEPVPLQGHDTSPWTPENLAIHQQQSFVKTSSAWTPASLAIKQKQQNLAKETPPAWTPEVLKTTHLGGMKNVFVPESPTAPESMSDTHITEKLSSKDPNEDSDDSSGSGTDSSDDSSTSSSIEENVLNTNQVKQEPPPRSIEHPVSVPIVNRGFVPERTTVPTVAKDFNVSQSTTTEFSEEDGEDSEDSSDDDDDSEESSESSNEPQKEVISSTFLPPTKKQPTPLRTPPNAFQTQQVPKKPATPLRTPPNVFDSQEVPKTTSQKPPRPPQPDVPDDVQRAQMMLKSKFAMFHNLSNPNAPQANTNKMQLPSPLTSPSTNYDEEAMSGDLNDSNISTSSGGDDSSNSDDSSASSDSNSDSSSDEGGELDQAENDALPEVSEDDVPIPTFVTKDPTAEEEEEPVNYPDMSQHFEFIQDAELKRLAAKLHKRLNIDPWDETDKFKDDYVHDFIQEHPETCRVQYFYNHFNERLFPLSMLCALGASAETIKVAYDAYKFAADQCDPWVGTPLHYACAYKATLDVVQFLIDRKPSMMTKVNDLQRTPLHLACLFKTSMGTIALLINKFPEVLTMADRNGCTPLHLAAENGASTGVVSALIRANKSTCMARTKSSLTPLHLACAGAAPRSVIKTLMDAEPQAITALDDMGRTPLHIAAQFCAPLSTIQMLVKASPDMVEEETHRGETPLQLATKHKAAATVLKFLS